MNMSLTQKQVRDSARDQAVGGEEAIGCLKALQLTSSYILPSMLNAAVELDVFGIIARRGPGARVSAGEIASEIPEESEPGIEARLDRMLCLFASHSLLTCSLRAIGEEGHAGFERIYGLTTTANFFLPTDHGKSVASFLPAIFHRALVQCWPHGKGAILKRRSPFEEVHGKSLFEYMSVDPAFNNIFNQVMADLSMVVMEEVLNIYGGFEGLSSLVDVGGGTGKCLNMVVSKYPSIEGINFDEPHVIRDAPSYPGVEHVGGDMFVSIPEGEAIIIKEILHDWNDECCIKLLKKCYEALPEKGKVIAINILMREAPDSSAASKYTTQMNNVMPMMFESHERTAKEYEGLCKASGFLEFRVAKLAHSIWGVMEFCK